MPGAGAGWHLEQGASHVGGRGLSTCPSSAALPGHFQEAEPVPMWYGRTTGNTRKQACDDWSSDQRNYHGKFFHKKISLTSDINSPCMFGHVDFSAHKSKKLRFQEHIFN